MIPHEITAPINENQYIVAVQPNQKRNETMNRWMMISLLSASALFLASCGTTTAGAIHKGKETAATVLLPVEEEKKLGVEFQKELDKELKYHSNPKVQAYITALGNKIVAVAQKDAPKIKFTFKVVDDDKTVNAFAIPGGTIYFYSGLLLKADSEAEVAGVLGHEVAHVTERHIAERLVAANGLNMVMSMALGKNPAALGKIVSGAVAQGYLLKFGRDQERESDTRGFHYAVKAGFNPEGMKNFFIKLDKMGSSGPAILSSHPNPGERAQTLGEMIKKRSNLPTYTGKEQYAAFKAELQNKSAAPATTTPTTNDTAAPAK